MKASNSDPVLPSITYNHTEPTPQFDFHMSTDSTSPSPGVRDAIARDGSGICAGTLAPGEGMRCVEPGTAVCRPSAIDAALSYVPGLRHCRH